MNDINSDLVTYFRSSRMLVLSQVTQLNCCLYNKFGVADESLYMEEVKDTTTAEDLYKNLSTTLEGHKLSWH